MCCGGTLASMTMRTISSWAGFGDAWNGPLNFLMSGECAPFAFDLPPVEQVIAEMCDEPGTYILSGIKSDSLDQADIAEIFRAKPLAEAIDGPFTMMHFKLSQFDEPGRFLHGFEAQVMAPWRAALDANGFTYDRCSPIIFISGRGCTTNYHMDFSHVLAWQRYGSKHFHGLKDPNRWAPRDVRNTYKPEYEDNPSGFSRPSDLADDDALSVEMRPGSVLWNVLLTPHWVDAGDEIAMSINLSHGGLRYQGDLSPNEADLAAYRLAAPGHVPETYGGTY